MIRSLFIMKSCRGDECLLCGRLACGLVTIVCRLPDMNGLEYEPYPQSPDSYCQTLASSYFDRVGLTYRGLPMPEYSIEQDSKGAWRASIRFKDGGSDFQGGFKTREDAETWLRRELRARGITDLPSDTSP
jgi:hypothetical protein